MLCNFCGNEIVKDSFNPFKNFLYEGLCGDCSKEVKENALEKALNRINYNVPKMSTCSECGNWFHTEDYPKHLPCQEREDAKS